MSDFLKDKSKKAGDFTSNAVKKSVSFLLLDVVKEVVDELGISKKTKLKVMNSALKVAKELGIETKEIKKEVLKSAIKKELKL